MVESNRSIAEVAREYGLNETTVGGWVKKFRAAHVVDEPPLELTERARLRELERRSRELEVENAFLKKSSSVLRQGATVTEKTRVHRGAARCRRRRRQGSRRSSGCAHWWRCRSLAFYEWRGRPVSATGRRRELLAEQGPRPVRGVRRHLRLSGASTPSSSAPVNGSARNGPPLMPELDLVPVQPRPFRTTTEPTRTLLTV